MFSFHLNAMIPLNSITFISIVGVLFGIFSHNVKAADPFPPYGPPISERVTPEFFYGILNKAGGGCAGKGFYTRDAFLGALNMHPHFGRRDFPRREIAAFFAHVTHETGHMCFKEEQNPSQDYCDPSTQYPCVPGRRYYGRGPLQLTHNYNYGPAGNEIGLNLLQNPEIVANDPSVAFKTSMWFWMTNVHKIVVTNQGFGNTIRAINGGECNGGNQGQVQSRVNYYLEYCNQLGAQPGANLYC